MKFICRFQFVRFVLKSQIVYLNHTFSTCYCEFCYFITMETQDPYDILCIESLLEYLETVSADDNIDHVKLQSFDSRIEKRQRTYSNGIR